MLTNLHDLNVIIIYSNPCIYMNESKTVMRFIDLILACANILPTNITSIKPLSI